MLIALLALAATDPVAAGNLALKRTIVDAIRNCPVSTGNEIAVCSPDRGWAEGCRLPKIAKPVVPSSGPGISVSVMGATTLDGCADPRGCRRDDEDRLDAATRERLTRPPRR